MRPVPQIEPITQMARDHKTMLRKLENGPIYLAQRSRPAAVLVSVADWEQMVAALDHYKHLALLDERSSRIDRGDYITQSQLEKELKERDII